MAMEPTAEQQASREAFVAGRDLALVAGAGTGKTSTLILMGSSTRHRGLYIAFNRTTADDARGRFGRNVDCRTTHSLAFRAVGYRYEERRRTSARLPAKQTARILGITRDLDYGPHRRIRIEQQARLVMGMIRKFCQSTDLQVAARHAEPVNGLDADAQNDLALYLLRYAVQAWEDIKALNGKLRFEHDHYMKLWAMTQPALPADFILLDEAQDTNPVMEEVFLAQDAQRVCVGDPAQKIYGWRGARDVMTGFPAEHLHLTESFRFGPEIAEVANRWLRHAESDMQLTGRGHAGSCVGKVARPDAVLVRGHADAMAEILAFLDLGVPVALTGGGTALERIANAAQELKAGHRTSHPELFLFNTWEEVQDYAEQDSAGQDLKAIVGLVDAYGPEKILQAVRRLSDEDKAQVTVSTAHKAKGREWDSVRIGPGFAAPGVDEHGTGRPLSKDEARLIYVAVSRARRHLDPEGIAWIDDYEKAAAGNVGRPLIQLSLTAQLKHPASPVSEFMNAHLPGTGNVERAYLARLPALPHPVEPMDVRYPDWAALGHAIDYRLRMALGGRLGSAVTLGVHAFDDDQTISNPPPAPVREALLKAGMQLLSTVDAYLSNPRGWTDPLLAKLCYVASFYEDIMRTGQIRRYSMLTAATPATTLADLTAAVPGHVIDDIAQQLQLAEDPLAALLALPADARVCGPVFTGSSDLGGADADYILGGLLLDCKATTRPRRLGRDEIYQLTGYLLLDYDDRYRINSVGLYLSRQGGLITWTTAEFLTMLGAAKPLPQLRTAFRAHLRRHRATAH